MNILTVFLVWSFLACVLGFIAVSLREDIQKAIDNRNRHKREAIQAKQDLALHEHRRFQAKMLLEKKMNNRVALAEFDTQLHELSKPLVLCGPCSTLRLGYGRTHTPLECEGYIDVPPDNVEWASYDLTRCQCPLCKGV